MGAKSPTGGPFPPFDIDQATYDVTWFRGAPPEKPPTIYIVKRGSLTPLSIEKLGKFGLVIIADDPRDVQILSRQEVSTMLQPTSDRIIVEAEGPATRTSSGLHLPANYAPPPQRARVLIVGPDCVTIKVGDRVLFSKYSGVEIEENEKRLIVMFEKDVLAVYQE